MGKRVEKISNKDLARIPLVALAIGLIVLGLGSSWATAVVFAYGVIGGQLSARIKGSSGREVLKYGLLWLPLLVREIGRGVARNRKRISGVSDQKQLP